MALNPPTQYADDRNLAARQRLWDHQTPPFDLVGWTLDLASPSADDVVVDVGCGNGAYLRALAGRGVAAIGCDLSIGMLRATGSGPLVNGDVQALPFRAAAADVVLAPHMLYHVPDRAAAAAELRRVLRPGGRCVVVTNGAAHMGALRALVEDAAGHGWEMRNPSTHAFSLENGGEQLGAAFADVERVDPVDVGAVVLRDAEVAAGYVASVADHYQDQVERPWAEVVAEVRERVAAVIAAEGSFVVRGRVGAFVCR